MKSRKRFASIVALILVLLMLFSVLVSALGTIAGAVSQSEIDALKEQKEALQSQQSAIAATISELQTEKETELEQKAALDEQNELAQEEIDVINEQIELYDQLIAEKADELEEAKAAEEVQKEAYRTRMRAMEEEGTVSYLSIIFGASSFSDLLSRIDFVREIMEYDKGLEDQYIAAREHVEEVKAEYEATQEEQEATKVELEVKKADLEAQIESANAIILAIESDIDQNQTAYNQNEQDAAELEDEINEKIAELEEQRKAEEEAAAAAAAAAAAQQTTTNTTTSSGSTVTGTTTPSTEVATGMFIWPTTSYTISSNWGYRIHPISGVTKYHAGVDISNTSGQPIYAAASGTVVTAVYSTSYGNYVMIDHGNGYYTLYAHQTRYIVSAGQTVSQGEVIGYVGSTGYSTGPHLHFEVRVNGSTVNPLSFF